MNRRREWSAHILPALGPAYHVPPDERARERPPSKDGVAREPIGSDDLVHDLEVGPRTEGTDGTQCLASQSEQRESTREAKASERHGEEGGTGVSGEW